MKLLHKRILFVLLLVAASFLSYPIHYPRFVHPEAPTPEAASSSSQSTRPYTIIVMPDTQAYAQFFPEIFMAQTSWIAAQAKERNIVFVSQEGDIVNIPEAEGQWQVASAAMALLDGIVPYGLAPGNHDFTHTGSAPLYQKYFPMSRLKRSPAWGGSFLEFNTQLNHPNLHRYDKNSYQLFEVGNTKYIAFNLEFCPPDDVVYWTGWMLALYPNRQAIITTHSFTNFKGGRSNSQICKHYGAEGLNAGEEIWQKLAVDRTHLNISLLLSGHDIITTRGAARRTDVVDNRPIHQLLANYQQLPNGGNGYLRIMTFKPAEQKIQVETYSPYIDRYMTDPENQFDLPL